MEWFDTILPMRSKGQLDAKGYDVMLNTCIIQEEEEDLGEKLLDSFATPILEAKYEKVDISSVVEQQEHLTKSQRQDLTRVLQKHMKLFDGTLGKYPKKKFHIEVEKHTTPVHARAYAVPKLHYEVFKKTLQELVRIGVLSPLRTSE